MKQHKTHLKQNAFSLVELSIVLVILGLLVGGVLAGQTLIHAAEVRSVTSDLHQYQTAINTFRTKYGNYPGDIPNATQYWAAPAGGCPYGASVGTQTCGGDGNGQISTFNDQYTNYEIFRFWQHLANAGYVSGTFTGITGPGTYWALVGENVPASEIGGAGFALYNLGSHSGDQDYFDGKYGHVFLFGGDSPYSYNYDAKLPIQDAYAIDQKIDDGNGASGNVATFKLSAQYGQGGCVDQFVPGTPWRLHHEQIKCVMIFKLGF